MKAEFLKAHFKSELAAKVAEIKESYDKWGNLIYILGTNQSTDKKELVNQLRAELEKEYNSRLKR